MGRMLFALVLSAAIATGCGSNAGPPAQESNGATAKALTGPLDACKVISQDELSALVGNPLATGEHFAGSEVCKWDAEPGHTNVLLTVRPAGSLREQSLCPELKKSTDGQRVDGLADVAIWKFSNTMGLFNTGDLETCGSKGYISLSVSGKLDEAPLKQQTVSIFQAVLKKL